MSEKDIFGYPPQGRRKPIETNESIIRTMKDWLNQANHIVYTTIVNMNRNEQADVFLCVILVFNNEPINISDYVARLCGLKKKDRLSTYVRVPKGTEAGLKVTKLLQDAVYDGSFIKHKLTHKWL